MGKERGEEADREWGDWRESLEVFGLERLGGGPEREAMPGAEAQQAGKRCRCVYEEGRSRGDVRRGRKHTERRGDDGSKKQRSDASLSFLAPLPPAQHQHCLQLSAQQTTALLPSATGISPSAPTGALTTPSIATPPGVATMQERTLVLPSTQSQWQNSTTAPTRSTMTRCFYAASAT